MAAALARAVADALLAQTTSTSLGRRSTNVGNDVAERLGRVSGLAGSSNSSISTGCRRSGSANPRCSRARSTPQTIVSVLRLSPVVATFEGVASDLSSRIPQEYLKNTSEVPKHRTIFSLNSFNIVLALASRMGTHSTQRVDRSSNTKIYSYPCLLFTNGPVTSPATTCHGCSITRWPINPAGGRCSAFVC